MFVRTGAHPVSRRSVGAALMEHLHHTRVALATRPMERRAAIGIFGFEIGLELDEELVHLLLNQVVALVGLHVVDILLEGGLAFAGGFLRSLSTVCWLKPFQF